MKDNNNVSKILQTGGQGITEEDLQVFYSTPEGGKFVGGHIRVTLLC